MWSSPENPLKKSLLDSDTETLLRTGDLLLAQASELDISLDCEVWSHVAIVVYKDGVAMAFMDGVFVPIAQWLNNHENVITRHCNCIRQKGFDKRVLEAAEKTAKTAKTMECHFREGFCAGTVLERLGLASAQGVARGGLRPSHFLADTAFPRLKLRYFSRHWSI